MLLADVEARAFVELVVVEDDVQALVVLDSEVVVLDDVELLVVVAATLVDW